VRKIVNHLSILIVLLFSLNTLASGGESSIPWGFIKIQAFNFVLLFVILAYFLKDKVKNHFIEKSENYYKHVKEAEAAKVKAEAEKQDLIDRLKILNQTEEKSLKNAELDAKLFVSKKEKEAEVLSKRLREEAEKSVSTEVNRLEKNLKQKILLNSIEKSKQALSQKMQKEDLERLQVEFVNKIQVVQ
jgi:F-type H+-transporting ATPase subunit b